MAKKNKGKGKVTPLLSPENYIRKKARTLPIRECMINASWEDTQMANLYIVREHGNGNITVGIYLVDLMCLGVKDTFYLFNLPRWEFDERMRELLSKEKHIPVSYELVHNIIYSGVAFAEEYGFMPHRDFTSVTRFILEEDTEDIEEIGIECGINGMPAYGRGPCDSEGKADRVIAQLMRTAGPGKFILLDIESEDDFDDDDFDDDPDDDEDGFDEDSDDDDDDSDDDPDDDDDDDPDDDEITHEETEFIELLSMLDHMTFEEKLGLLPVLDSSSDLPAEHDAFMLSVVTNSLVEYLTDEDEVEQYQEEYGQLFSFDISYQNVDHHLLGLPDADHHLTDTLGERLKEALLMFKNEPEKSHRVAQGFMRESNGIPGACFLDLLALQKNQSSRYDVRLQEYAKKYPDYHMIRMIQTIDKVLDLPDEHLLHDIPASRDTFFPGRTAIHTIEFDHFLMLQFALAQQKDDLSKLRALQGFLAEFSMQTLMVRYVRAMIVMKMYRHILQHYKHES